MRPTAAVAASCDNPGPDRRQSAGLEEVEEGSEER